MHPQQLHEAAAGLEKECKPSTVCGFMLHIMPLMGWQWGASTPCLDLFLIVQSRSVYLITLFLSSSSSLPLVTSSELADRVEKRFLLLSVCKRPFTEHILQHVRGGNCCGFGCCGNQPQALSDPTALPVRSSQSPSSGSLLPPKAQHVVSACA
ncbi:hypothetical protein KUCAC02_017573, partial [Chaenocephalus aceratus]